MKFVYLWLLTLPKFTNYSSVPSIAIRTDVQHHHALGSDTNMCSEDCRDSIQSLAWHTWSVQRQHPQRSSVRRLQVNPWPGRHHSLSAYNSVARADKFTWMLISLTVNQWVPFSSTKFIEGEYFEVFWCGRYINRFVSISTWKALETYTYRVDGRLTV